MEAAQVRAAIASAMQKAGLETGKAQVAEAVEWFVATQQAQEILECGMSTKDLAYMLVDGTTVDSLEDWLEQRIELEEEEESEEAFGAALLEDIADHFGLV